MEPSVWSRRKEQLKRRRQGKKGGLHARLKAMASRPPLPGLLLANVQSVEDKMDEPSEKCETAAHLLSLKPG